MQTPEIIMLTPVSNTTTTKSATTLTTTATISGSKTKKKLIPSSDCISRNMFNTPKMSPSWVTAKNLAIKPKILKNLNGFWLWPLLIMSTLRVTYSQGKFFFSYIIFKNLKF